MEIEIIVIVGAIAILVTIAGIWVARHLRASRASADTAVSGNVIAVGANPTPLSIATPERPPSRQLVPVDDPTVAGDLVVLGVNGEVMLACREIDYLPPSPHPDEEENGVALNRARQLSTDLIRGSMMLPGKTVEIVFDPAIQRGLSSGTFEVVKVASGDGQRLMARTVDSKKFVGQGRFIAAGKLKQLGVGAFHIVSIAVAQAHLAEINKNLEEIKGGIKDIRDFMEIKDNAQLTGTVEYLEYIVDFIRRMDSPDQLPIE